MKKKLLAVVFAALLTLPCTGFAENRDVFYGHWDLNNERVVFFASDGGTYIRPIEKPTGTLLNLNDYVPEKEGFIFQGWFSDPRTKIEKVESIVLNKNIVVYAKWLDDGTPKPIPPERDYATNAEIMAYGNHIDENTGVPVTALWVEQNARLQALMQVYNQKFNN